MNLRHLFGDAALAVLLALPTATLAGPTAIRQSHATASAPQVRLAAAQPAQSRFGLPG